jgi:hypothetical protein
MSKIFDIFIHIAKMQFFVLRKYGNFFSHKSLDVTFFQCMVSESIVNCTHLGVVKETRIPINLIRTALNCRFEICIDFDMFILKLCAVEMFIHDYEEYLHLVFKYPRKYKVKLLEISMVSTCFNCS